MMGLPPQQENEVLWRLPGHKPSQKQAGGGEEGQAER